MTWRSPLQTAMVLCGVLVWPAGGCRSGDDDRPAPDARRPTIKSEAQLVAERAERIRARHVVPTSAPALLAAEATPARKPPPVPVHPGPGAIEAEILLVNDAVLTLPEVLYPLRQAVAEARKTQTDQGFLEAIQRMLQVAVWQDIDAVLIYRQAMSRLSDPQVQFIGGAVDRRVHERITQEFSGSSARFQNHLARHGLTPDQYRARLERDMVSRQYTREKLLPQITVTRPELMAYYQRNRHRWSSQETRDLWMIEAPFQAFLPPGITWAQTPDNARAQARLQAKQHMDAAHAALSEQSFDQVARERSKGVHAAQGGVWGEIGRPLQPPYDQVSKLVFQLDEGGHSRPVETELGWYIVGCGKVTPAEQVTFVEAQEEIRQQLTEQKFHRLLVEYRMELAKTATISPYPLDPFIRAAIQRILQQQPEEESTATSERQ